MKDEDETKVATMVISMLAMIFVAFMVLCYMHCQSSDAKREKCVEETHDIYGCDCMYSLGRSCQKPTEPNGSAK